MICLSIGRIGEAVVPGTARILVDRLWPRGIAKSSASWDLWARDLAPSHELRRWYAHAAGKQVEFGERYQQELQQAPAELLSDVLGVIQRQPTILLTYTRELMGSHVPILRGYLLEQLGHD